MSETCLLNSQISSILDTLAAAAVRDVCKVVHDSYAGLRAQFSQSREEVEFLKRRLKLAESGGESTAPWIPVTTLSRTDSSSASAAFVVVDAEASDPESSGVGCRSAPEVEDVCSATATAVVPVASNQELKPVTASEGQRHITCLRMGETPRIEKCTTCCSLYHCPFCPTSVFKPNKFRRLARHVKFHQNQAVQHGEFTIYECLMACRETGHFHCCYCSETITHRAAFQEHVLQCRERTQSSARRQPPTPPASAPPPPPTPTPLTELSPPPPCASPSHCAPEGLQPPLSPALDSSAGQGLSSDVRYFFIPDSDASGSESEPESSDSPGPLSSPPTPGADLAPVPSPSPSSSALHHCAKTVPAPATTSAAHTPGQGEPALTGTNATTTTTTNTATSADIGRGLKTQCHFCGIILNRNNFIMHVKRKHEDKFLEVKNQEVHRKYVAGWKSPLVQCHRCTVTLNEKSLRKHMKRRHNEEFSGEAWEEVLRKRRKDGVHCPDHVIRSFLEKVSLSVLEEANNKFLKEQEEREAACRGGRDEEVQDTDIDLDPWGEEHQPVEPNERGEEHQPVEPNERGEEHQPVEPNEMGEEHQPVEPNEMGEEHQPVEPDERGEEHQPVEPYKREEEDRPVDPGDLLTFRPVPVTRKESEQTSTMHHSIRNTTATVPPLEQCTTCCKKYHCPFCLNFKPARLPRLKSHVEAHLRNALTFEDLLIIKCGLECRGMAHFHCPWCKNTVLRAVDMKRHLLQCKTHSCPAQPPSH